MTGLWLALWSLFAGPSEASVQPPPALVFSGDGWTLPVGPAELDGFEAFAPETGGVGLLVTLRPEPARDLERLTGSGGRLTLADADGATITERAHADPIRGGRFMVTFADAEAGQRVARRLLGQE